MTDERNTLGPSIAPCVKELDNLFSSLNEKYYNSALPKPVITLSLRGTKSAKGWCTQERVWAKADASQSSDRYYEINICPEYLNRPTEEICEVLLHEMVHLSNTINGVQDCGSNGQYHNRHFKVSAELHGLNVERIPNYGYAQTSLKPETAEFIRSLNLTAFDLYRDAVRKNITELDSSQKKQSSTRKYICPNCSMSIRATKKVQVICGKCNVPFEEYIQQVEDKSNTLPVIRRKENSV